MMAGCMGGGIGAAQVFGWPLSDWAVVLLLFVISVLTIALISALAGVVASWFHRPARPESEASPPRTAEGPAR